MTKTSKRKSRTHMLVWRGITCRVKHTPRYFDYADHVELFVVKPKGAILPITETGYRSEFLSAEELATAGGAVTFITGLLEREAKTKRWQKRDFESRQLKLFD